MSAPGLLSRIKASVIQRLQRTLNCGSVEGVLFIDGVPAPAGVWVACNYLAPGRDETFSFESKFVETNPEGRFKFWFLPAGETCIGQCFPDLPGSPQSVERRVEVRVGETTTVNIGCGPGRITGRFRVPNPYAEFISMKDLPPIYLVCDGHAPDAPAERVREYSGAWRRSIGGENAPQDDYGRWYSVRITEDSVLNAGGVLPGEYSLRFSLPSEFWGSVAYFSPPSFGFFRTTVPCTDQAFLDIDLGEIELPEQGLSLIGTARIEGRLYLNGKSAPRGTKIVCNVPIDWRDEYEDEHKGTCGYILGTVREACTDKEGRFTFDCIQLGEARVGRPRAQDEVSEEEEDGKAVDWHDDEFDGEVARLRLKRSRTEIVMLNGEMR